MGSAETTGDARKKAGANLASSVARLAAVVVASCLIYILSIGPVAAAMAWREVGADDPVGVCLHTFYSPIVYLHDHTRLRGPVEQYVNWWEALGERLR
jgi:hypothetical protein